MSGCLEEASKAVRVNGNLTFFCAEHYERFSDYRCTYSSWDGVEELSAAEFNSINQAASVLEE